jgi:hypothetical protein
MVAITGDSDARTLQGHRQLATNLIIVNSAIIAVLMVGPSVGGPTFTETVQKGLHWADDSLVWGMLCTAALVLSIVAAIATNQNKTNDPTETTFRIEVNKNSVIAEVVAPSLTIVYGIVVLTLTAVGFVLGQTPSAADPQSSLELSTSLVKDGDTYSATAKGFTPGEVVKFSWDGGPMGNAPAADSAGSTTLLPIKETALPGTYTLTASGQTSGHTATAKVQVVPSGN